MDQVRLKRMRQAMEAAHLDALVVRLPENVLLLSGFWQMIGATTLVFPREGRTVCIAPECFENETNATIWDAEVKCFRFGILKSPDMGAAVSDALKETAKGKGWKRVGYEATFYSIAPSWHSGEVWIPNEQSRGFYEASFPGCELVDATQLLQSERRRKTEYEAAKLRIANEISCIGMAAFEGALAVGITGVELVSIVESEIMRKGTGYKGATRVRGYAQIATGAAETADGYRMHEISTTRKLADGDLAMLELGVVADGYWADRTRVRVAGTPTDEQIRVYDTVKRAGEASIAAIRPGAVAGDVDAAGRAVIEDAGFGDEEFLHITGHGLGYAYHEAGPMIAPGATHLLEEGNFTSVEPGIYFMPFGGIRIEDDVLVTPTGAEVFGPFRKTLS